MATRRYGDWLALTAAVACVLPLCVRADEWLPPGWKAVSDLRGSGRLYYWDMATNRSRLCAARSDALCDRCPATRPGPYATEGRILPGHFPRADLTSRFVLAFGPASKTNGTQNHMGSAVLGQPSLSRPISTGVVLGNAVYVCTADVRSIVTCVFAVHVSKCPVEVADRRLRLGACVLCQWGACDIG